MTHTYTVTGMTCNGCKAKVEETLRAVTGISDVSVDLETSEVKLTMTEHMSLDVLKEALPDTYEISKKEHNNIFENSVNTSSVKNASELRQLFPLFLIFGYILVASILLNMKTFNVNGFMLDFMGLFYVVFSFFKFLDLKGFPKSFRMYDPLAKQIPLYGMVYPFIELALGMLFLMRVQIPVALIITIVILGITTIGVIRTLLDKKTIQCACLGTVLKLPMTKATFIENTIMIIMAVIMLFKTYTY
ncbi:MAG: heavy metal transporter [Algicola sp.]|nr:heavy metal transporter [Algicola sp.]